MEVILGFGVPTFFLVLLAFLDMYSRKLDDDSNE